MGLLALGFAGGWRANGLRAGAPPLPPAAHVVAPEPLAEPEPLALSEPVLLPETEAHDHARPLASDGRVRRAVSVPGAAGSGAAASGRRERASEGAKAPPVDSHAREELALLQRAERAVRAGDAALGLALIAELETKYARSKLLEERRAIELMAHCAVGSTEGAARAVRFLRDHPRSIYAARIQALCHPRAMPSR
jgi:hypothetical protein